MAGKENHPPHLSLVKKVEATPQPHAALPPFRSIYRQYFDFVWASARRLGATGEATDDLVQEIFVIIHARLHTLERPEALRSWIYGIVRRSAATHRRAQSARGTTVPLDLGDDSDAQSSEPTPLEHAERSGDLELLTQILDELDEPKREIFALVEIDELTVPEAADMLQIPLNTAYSRLRAARRAFDAAFARHEARSKGK